MPANRPTTPVSVLCPTCDGFPVVAVTVGTRRSDGTLPTLPMTCPDCSGTGTGTGTRPALRPARVLVAR